MHEEKPRTAEQDQRLRDTEMAHLGGQDDLSERTLIQQVRSGDRPGIARQEWAHFLAFGDEHAYGGVQRLRLGATPVRIGRRAPCDIVLADGEVSGVHCEVRVHGQDVFVTDLGSTNGTFVNGRRAAPRLRLSSGASLQVGRQLLKLETRDRFEFAEAQELQRDLERARRYVRSQLPPPLHQGPVHVDWFFEPSAQVGGDGFGYYALDDRHLVGYVIDVSGHGVGAAMHLVTVMNTLRQRSLPETNFADPAQVLTRLNTMFQMDQHDDMLFSIWYGVLDVQARRLAFASAGHHPGYLLPASGRPLRPLQTLNPMIGALESVHFKAGEAELAPGDRLYLFSDGVFEIVAADGSAWGLVDFVELLGRPPSAPDDDMSATEPERLFSRVRRIARPGALDDDFSILVATLT